MTVRHLAATATGEEVAEVLAADGCVVVDDLIDGATVDALLDEMAPWIEATSGSGDEFGGFLTRRTGGLVARSATSRELIRHPLVLDTVDRVLVDSTTFHVHLTQLIAIGPGETAQTIHRDQWAFDFFPFPSGYEAQCNTIWALTDFTEENGATRVIPGSHRWEDKLRPEPDQTEPAEMGRGSVFLYTGSVYHGGGANRSEETRIGGNLTYARSWLRQEENQYLSVPPEVAVDLDDDLLRLLGWARGAYALGYVDDLRDPLDALRGRSGSATLATDG